MAEIKIRKILINQTRTQLFHSRKVSSNASKILNHFGSIDFIPFDYIQTGQIICNIFNEDRE